LHLRLCPQRRTPLEPRQPIAAPISHRPECNEGEADAVSGQEPSKCFSMPRFDSYC
jgi:hypothetical protein